MAKVDYPENEDKSILQAEILPRFVQQIAIKLFFRSF